MGTKSRENDVGTVDQRRSGGGAVPALKDRRGELAECERKYAAEGEEAPGDVEEDEFREEWIRRLAHHEAGHAVVGMTLGQRVEWIEFVDAEKADPNGDYADPFDGTHVKFEVSPARCAAIWWAFERKADEPPPGVRAVFEADMASNLAGMIAEHVLAPEEPPPWACVSLTIKFATEIRESGVVVAPGWDSDLHLAAHAALALVRDDDAIRSGLEVAAGRAESILRERWAAVCALADALIEALRTSDGYLSGDEVTAIVGPCSADPL